VKFWDASAVVPMLATQEATDPLRLLLDGDPSVVVWWATRTECVSALARLRRDSDLSADAERDARAVLETLAAAWAEIAPSGAVRDRAERLLGVHGLRAADAFQLAAALLWSRGRTRDRVFVCLDHRLRDAAGREGFRVVPV
jgi:hypothetical protein